MYIDVPMVYKLSINVSYHISIKYNKKLSSASNLRDHPDPLTRKRYVLSHYILKGSPAVSTIDNNCITHKSDVPY